MKGHTLKGFIDSIKVPVLVSDEGGGVIFMNPGGAALFYSGKPQNYARDLLELPFPLDRAVIQSIFERFKGGRSDNFDLDVELEGKVINVTFLALSDKGLFKGAAVIAVDATEKREQEKNLRKEVDELTVFQRIAVGRELKMEELRVEIQALRSRIEELEED